MKTIMVSLTISFKSVFLLSTFFSLSLCALYAQEPAPKANAEKGAAPIANNQQPIDHSTTRAVTIGISDYQNENIPDLQYAHRDALAFARFLRSPYGGEVPEENMRLLINERATLGAIGEGLNWLAQTAKKGDRVYIYFAGHGDAEIISPEQQGYLLGYDSRPNVYATLTLGARDLNGVIEGLSQREVEVILIADACRAGKLAGSEINGKQRTADILMQQVSRETRMLSCRPEELSYEDAAYGGGRGVFSYYLLEGLYGAADLDEDGRVALKELQLYLEQQVPARAPRPQHPVLKGELFQTLALLPKGVERPAAATLENSVQSPRLLSSRGVVVAGEKQRQAEGVVDSEILVLVKQFEAAVEAGVLLESDLADSSLVSRSAEAVYQEVVSRRVGELTKAMKSDLLIALQDDANAVLNVVLSNALESDQGTLDMEKDFSHVPAYLRKARSLMEGESNVYKTQLRSKELFFSALLDWESAQEESSELGLRMEEYQRVRMKLDSAILLFPQAAYLHFYRARMVSRVNTNETVMKDLKTAARLSPAWAAPYRELAIRALGKSEIREAEEYADLAVKYSGGDKRIISWQNWFNCVLLYGQKRFDEMGDLALEGIRADSSFHLAYYSLWLAYSMSGRLEQAEEVRKQIVRRFARENTLLRYVLLYEKNIQWMAAHRWEEAEEACLAALRLKPNGSEALCGLARLYHRTGKTAQAEAYFKKAIEGEYPRFIDHSYWLRDLAYFYLDRLRLQEADSLYRQAYALNKNSLGGLPQRTPHRYGGANDLGRFLLQTQQYFEASKILEEALTLKPTTWIANHFEPTYNLGRAYYHLNAFQEMKNTFLQALQKDSTYSSTYTWLGLACQRLGELEEAEKWMKKELWLYENAPNLLPLPPYQAFTYFHLTLLMIEQGREEETLAYFEKCLENGGYPFEFIPVPYRENPPSNVEAFKREWVRQFMEKELEKAAPRRLGKFKRLLKKEY